VRGQPTLRGALLGKQIGTSKVYYLWGLGDLGVPHIWCFPEGFWRYVPRIATVGLVDGLWDNGAIGGPEETAVFRSNTRDLRGLRRNTEMLTRLRWTMARREG
jgi:hypothetical protein